jgi:hypothetical protein
MGTWDQPLSGAFEAPAQGVAMPGAASPYGALAGVGGAGAWDAPAQGVSMPPSANPYGALPSAEAFRGGSAPDSNYDRWVKEQYEKRKARRACKSCDAKAEEDKKKAQELAKKLGGKVVSVNRIDALIVHGSDTLNLGTGEHYLGAGVNAIPSLGASSALCVVVPNAGQTVDDVVSGASFGASASPSLLAGGGVSGSFNGSGWMGCVGGGVGLSPPVNIDVDYNWRIGGGE